MLRIKREFGERHDSFADKVSNMVNEILEINENLYDTLNQKEKKIIDQMKCGRKNTKQEYNVIEKLFRKMKQFNYSFFDNVEIKVDNYVLQFTYLNFALFRIEGINYYPYTLMLYKDNVLIEDKIERDSLVLDVFDRHMMIYMYHALFYCSYESIMRKLNRRYDEHMNIVIEQNKVITVSQVFNILKVKNFEVLNFVENRHNQKLAIMNKRLFEYLNETYTSRNLMHLFKYSENLNINKNLKLYIVEAIIWAMYDDLDFISFLKKCKLTVNDYQKLLQKNDAFIYPFAKVVKTKEFLINNLECLKSDRLTQGDIFELINMIFDDSDKEEVINYLKIMSVV